MTDRYTPEANAAIEQLQAAGFDYAEADMIYHGDMLGPALGAKTATLITSLREALEPFAKYDVGSIAVVGKPATHYAINVDASSMQPMLDHFRRARTALNPSRKETI